MKKRVLAALLALVMLFGMLPMSVFAENVDAGLNDTGDNEAVGYDTGDRDDDPVNSDEPNGQPPTSGTVVFTCSECGMTRTETVADLWTVTIDSTDHTKATAKFKPGAAFTLRDYVEENIDGHEFDQCHGGDDITWSWSASDSAWKANGNATITTKLRHSGGSTTPTGKPAALSKTHYFTLNCNTPGCTAHNETHLSTIFGNMYHEVETNNPYTYTIEFLPDKVNDDLKHSNHQLRETTTGYQIDPMRITWKWENGEWKGTSTACDNTGWPFYVYANVESTASSSTEETTTVNVLLRPIAYIGENSTAVVIDGTKVKNTDFGTVNATDNRFHVGTLSTTTALSGSYDDDEDETMRAVIRELRTAGFTPAADVASDIFKFPFAGYFDWNDLTKNADGTYTLNCTLCLQELTLDYNGGTLKAGEQDVAGYYVVGDRATLPILEKENHTFLGWEKQDLSGDGEGGGVIYLALNEAIPQPQEIAVDYNVTYVAKWQENPYLTLTYNANAPEGKSAEDVTNMPGSQKEYLQEGISVVTFQLSEDVPACDGYKFLGWATSSNPNYVTFPVENMETDNWKSTTGNPSYTLYAIWEKNAPTQGEVKKALGNVTVACLNPATGEKDCTSIVWPAFAGNYSIDYESLTKVTATQYTIEIGAEAFARAYGRNGQKIAHELYSSETLTWVLTYAEGKWTGTPQTDGVDNYVFVTHEPTKWKEVGKIASGETISATCTTTGRNAAYALTSAFVHYDTEVIGTNYSETEKAYTTEFKTDKYVDAIAKDCDKMTGETHVHKLTSDKETLNWVFSVESASVKDGKVVAVWTARPQTDADGEITVKCLEGLNVFVVPADSEGEPLTETSHSALSDATLDRIGFHAYDEVMDALLAGSFQSNAAVQAEPDVDEVAEELLTNGTFQIDSANNKANFEKNNILEKTDWSYVEPDENYMLGVLTLYSVKFVTEDAEHVTGVPADDYYLLSEEFKLPEPSRPGFKFLGWRADAQTPVSDPTTDAGSLLEAGTDYTVLNNVTFTAVWKAEMHPVQIVIYRNGDTTKAYKTVSLGQMQKGQTLDLTTLDVNDYYDGKNTGGKIDFYGWYNDGKWNSYLKDPANPPAGLEKITINGWTNLKCMVYDHEKVVVKALYDGSTDVKNAEVLYTGTARKGANTNEVLNGLGLPLDKTGYTHTEWFKDGLQYTFGEKETINGWTNAYVKYERKTYTIASDLRINGNTANLADGKTYAWTNRYGGKYEETIDYQPMFDALKERAMAVDAANEPVDAEIKLCFPGSTDKIFNETILTYGQEGGGWNPGVNNTAYIWGYATTSYEVTFETGEGATTVDSQIVKYGEKLAAFDEPTKYGYNFTGWTIKGTDETFDPANDTVTHKLTLVANWEKKDYLIASDLRINGSTANLADGKTYAWTNRYGGKYEETIDYQPMFDALKERAMAVDAANGPVDAEIKLCFPGTADKDFTADVTYYGDPDANWQFNKDTKISTAYIWGYATTIYEVTFDTDGGSAVAAKRVAYSKTLAEAYPIGNDFYTTKPGFVFDGWYTEEELAKDDGKAFDITTEPITKSMKLTAKWTEAKAGEPGSAITTDTIMPVYAYFETVGKDGKHLNLSESTLERLGLEYNAGGKFITYGSFETIMPGVDQQASYDKDSTVFQSAYKDFKDKVELFDGVKEFEGKSSIEWTSLDRVEAPHKDYTTESTLAYHLNGALKFFKLTFDKNTDDTVENMPVSDYYYEGESLHMIGVPFRAGYSFAGWYDDAACKTPHNFGDGTANADITVYAKWEKSRSMSFYLTIKCVTKNGKELKTVEYIFKDPFAEYSISTPKITGYTTKTKRVEGALEGTDKIVEVTYTRKSTGGGSTIESPNKKKDTAPALTLNTDDHFAFINGYPDGSVQPEGNVTRAETAAILYRIMGDECQSYYKTNSSSYSDVARGDWYNTYVATLENAGVIVDTRTNGKFRPNDAITRAELASMIAQFAGLESASAAKFNDVGSRYWAAEEIAIAAKMGWINGYPDGSFRPDRNVTRAELMAMVNRALGRTPKSEDDLLSGMKTWRDNANVNAWYYLDVQEATNDHTYTKSGTHETWKKLL